MTTNKEFRFKVGKSEAIVKATFTSGDHCYVCTEPKNVDITNYPVIRGVPIYFSCHFNLVDGKWVIEDHNYFYARRGDRYINDDCTPTQIKTLREAIEPAFQEFAKENASLIHEAHLSQLENKINTTEGEIEKKKAELEQLVLELEALNSEKRTCENKSVKCVDKFGTELKEGDVVDVQCAGEHKIYQKDNQLYFTPYGREDKVCDYFSNDLIKVVRFVNAYKSQ